MPDAATLVGEFERDQYTFAVHRGGEVHRVEARDGDSAPVLVCHIYNPFTSPDWFSGWFLDAWRPWIEQQARSVIADAATVVSERAPDALKQPDHIPR
jgi:hypothetical protein